MHFNIMPIGALATAVLWALALSHTIHLAGWILWAPLWGQVPLLVLIAWTLGTPFVVTLGRKTQRQYTLYRGRS